MPSLLSLILGSDGEKGLNMYIQRKRETSHRIYQPLAWWWGCGVCAFFFFFFFYNIKVAASSSMLDNPYGINHVSTFGFAGILWQWVWLCQNRLIELAVQWRAAEACGSSGWISPPGEEHPGAVCSWHSIIFPTVRPPSFQDSKVSPTPRQLDNLWVELQALAAASICQE